MRQELRWFLEAAAATIVLQVAGFTGAQIVAACVAYWIITGQWPTLPTPIRRWFRPRRHE